MLFVRQQWPFAVAFVAYTVMSTLLLLLTQVFVARRRAGFALVITTIFGLLRLPLPVLLAIALSSFGLIASQEIALAVGLTIGVIAFLPRVLPGYRPSVVIRRDVVKKLAHFSMANYLASALEVVPGFILPLLVLNILGAEANAFFYVAWLIALALSFISVAISRSLFAEGSHDESKLGLNAIRSAKLTALLVIPAVLVVLLLGDRLLLLFGDVYSESATTLLWLLAIAALPLSVNHLYFSVRRVQRRMKSVIGLNAGITVLTLVLSYLLLPGSGIVGIGIAWLSTQTAAALLSTFLLLSDGRRRAVSSARPGGPIT